MILRRLATAIQQQDWFTVLLEIMTVVLGVFLGIQVSNWNNARLEARQGEIFAERLIADLRIEAWSYDVTVDYYGDVHDNANMALAVLEGRAAASDDQLLIYAYRATQYTDRTSRRATYDELTSTGSISLIKDPVLRDTAMLVYDSPAVERTLADGSNSLYRIAFRKSLPVDTQVALGTHCGDPFLETGDYEIIGKQLNYACETGLSPAQIEESAQALRNAPEIIPLLRLRVMDVGSQLSNLTFSNRGFMESLHAIAREKP